MCDWKFVWDPPPPPPVNCTTPITSVWAEDRDLHSLSTVNTKLLYKTSVITDTPMTHVLISDPHTVPHALHASISLYNLTLWIQDEGDSQIFPGDAALCVLLQLSESYTKGENMFICYVPLLLLSQSFRSSAPRVLSGFFRTCATQTSSCRSELYSQIIYRFRQSGQPTNQQRAPSSLTPPSSATWWRHENDVTGVMLGWRTPTCNLFITRLILIERLK